MTQAPIHIVGAGPAGLAASIALARAGRDVHVYERNDTVGKRFQGDLQGLENWSSSENVLSLLHTYGIKPNFIATPFHSLILTDGKAMLPFTTKEPLFYLVKRGPFSGSLDNGLCQQALDHGVQIHYESSYPKEKADILATGPIRKAVIAADRGLVFQTTLPNMAYGIFHDELAYLGYSYLLVAEGYGCLCTVVFHQLNRLNSCFERTIEVARRLAPLNLDDARPVGGIGSFSLGHPVQLGATRLVGEAAGFQDLLWGFGIRTAVTSGNLAAQSLLTGSDYPKTIHDTFSAYLKASIVNRFLWEKVKLQQRPLLPFFMRKPFSIRTYFRLLYGFSPLHRLCYPFARRYVKQQYPESVLNF